MENNWRMNIQLFAEEPGEAQDQQEAQQTGQTPQEQPQTFTAEEVMKLVQSEADKRVTQALNKQRKEYEKKLSLTGLSEQERAIAEKDQRIADMEAELEEFRQFKARQEVAQELTARDLEPGFADLIEITEDEAQMKQRLDTLEKAFKAAVETAVKARLSGGRAPARGTSAPTLSRADFSKMNLAQQQALYHKDPETYKKMTE